MQTLEQIKQLSIIELKAMIFDESMNIETSKQKIGVLSQVLNEKLQAPVAPVEEPKK